MEEKEEKVMNQRKEKLKQWLTSKHNLVLGSMFLIVILVYIYNFFKLGNQPTWWDEGDYLAMAKIWAFNMSVPEWWGNLSLMRPPIIPFLWSLMFKFGLGELFVRFLTELVPALVSIIFVYKLGKSMFNKNVGLVAAGALSFNWVFMFYSFRLLTDSPALMFATLSLYFFWEGYEKNYLNEKKENVLYLCLAVILGILAFMTRYAVGTVIFSIALYLIITRNLGVFKNKNMWWAVLAGILTLAPLFIYYYLQFGNIFPALEFYQGADSGAASRGFAYDVLYLKIPNFFGSFGVIFFTIGFVLLLEFLLYFDLILKQKEHKNNNLLFCFIGIIVPISYFIFGIRGIDERYLVSVSPLMFVTLGYAVDFLSDKISSILKSKYIHIGLVFLITLILMIQQYGMATNFINRAYGSYGPIQEAGLWLKENTPADSKILTASTVQILYYSERETYTLWGNNSIYSKCFDVNGVMTNNGTCITGTERMFNEKLAQIDPDYLIVHSYEPVFTPQWAYDYPIRHNLTFVKAFGNNNNQPTLIIYKFNK